jgi:hypothetical protein
VYQFWFCPLLCGFRELCNLLGSFDVASVNTGIFRVVMRGCMDEEICKQKNYMLIDCFSLTSGGYFS